jgi:hypothetical protein
MKSIEQEETEGTEFMQFACELKSEIQKRGLLHV